MVVLAAGASRRMGRPKALLPLRGRTFVEVIGETARAAGALEVVAVVGPPDGEAIAAALPGSMRAAWNEAPARGMLSSVKVGIAALHEGAAAALVWPVDQPLVTVETVAALAAARPEGAIAVPQHGGRGGHPLRIPRAHFPELRALPDPAGLRALLAAHAAEVLRLPVDDPACVEDLDTPEDYRARIDR